MDEEKEARPERFLVIGADDLGLGVGPNREVAIELRGLEKQIGLAPGVGVMLNLTATEARLFADALRSTADKAEEGLPRA